jgi:hypothetical protein
MMNRFKDSRVMTARRPGPGPTFSVRDLLDPAQMPDDLVIDILREIANGRTHPDVAERCHVSERTLCRELAEVRALWNVESTIEAVVIATRFRLI